MGTLMKRPQAVVLLTLCVALLASCATQRRGPTEPITFKFEYESGDDLDERFGTMGGSTCSFDQVLALADEPAYLSKKPMLGALQLGGAEGSSHALVSDESKGTGTGHDVLYVDANGDESLKDDAPLKATTREGTGSTYFPAAEFRVAYAGETLPYHVSFRRCSPTSTHIHVYSAGFAEGELRAGGKAYKAYAFDDTGNGLFNDTYAVPEGSRREGRVYARGDSLCIDLDGDGNVKKTRYGAPEVFPMADYVSLDGRCYALNVAPNGRSVTLGPCSVECGYLVPPKGRTFAVLLGEHGGVAVYGQARKVEAPAGTYQLAHCSFEADDAEGKTWRAIGRGQWEQPELQLASGKKTKLAAGPPFVAEVLAEERGGNEYRFNLKISGQGGETYTARDFRPLDQEESPPAPTMKVLDEKGETIATGTFEYG